MRRQIIALGFGDVIKHRPVKDFQQKIVEVFATHMLFPYKQIAWTLATKKRRYYPVREVSLQVTMAKALQLGSAGVIGGAEEEISAFYLRSMQDDNNKNDSRLDYLVRRMVSITPWISFLAQLGPKTKKDSVSYCNRVHRDLTHSGLILRFADRGRLVRNPD